MVEVSVVVPIYNAGKKLDKCIKSILNQTFKDFELILVNDGSTDNSIKICRKYELKDSRVKVIDKENEGSIATRNLGIKKSIGNYITFVDADDYISLDAIEKLYKDVKEMDLDIVDFRVEEKENDRIEVFTKHVVDEYEAELNLFDESSGTKKLFGLLPFIAKSLLRGTTLVIDELDAKIHPVLLKYLIMTFSNMEKNKKGAQLIFTSHDLSTMNSEVFRRDEIWFVAKGNRQNSKLYSLVEFKNKKGESVRKDAKFDKQYLEGKYGADPYLRKIIDWGTVNG